MPIKLPSGTSPTKSRNKQMAEAELSSFEKKTQSAHLNINIKKMNLDGKEMIVGYCESDPYNYDGTRKLPEKYTDMEKFAKYVKEKVLAVAAELA